MNKLILKCTVHPLSIVPGSGFAVTSRVLHKLLLKLQQLQDFEAVLSKSNWEIQTVESKRTMTKNPRWWAWLFGMLPDPTNLWMFLISIWPRSKFDLQKGFSLNSDSTNGVDPWTYGKGSTAVQGPRRSILPLRIDFILEASTMDARAHVQLAESNDVKTLHRIKILFLGYSLLHQTTKLPVSHRLGHSKQASFVGTLWRRWEHSVSRTPQACTVSSEEIESSPFLIKKHSKVECKVNLQNVRPQPSLVRLPWKPLVGSSTNVWSCPVPGSAEAAVKGDAACEVLGCNQ